MTLSSVNNGHFLSPGPGRVFWCSSILSDFSADFCWCLHLLVGTSRCPLGGQVGKSLTFGLNDQEAVAGLVTHDRAPTGSGLLRPLQALWPMPGARMGDSSRSLQSTSGIMNPQIVPWRIVAALGAPPPHARLRGGSAWSRADGLDAQKSQPCCGCTPDRRASWYWPLGPVVPVDWIH